MEVLLRSLTICIYYLKLHIITMSKNLIHKQLAFLFFLFCITHTYTQTIHYVMPTTLGTGDGSSWANASSDLQAIIDTAIAGDEIWIAAGTYKPTRDALSNPNPTDPRERTFLLRDKVALYGGFAGNETALSQRDWLSNITNLSGDYQDDDSVTGTIQTTLSILNISDNAYHVLISIPNGTGINIEIKIDGLTIRGGQGTEYGSAITGYATINHLTGAGYCAQYTNSIINNCNFIQNSVGNYWYDGEGAGIHHVIGNCEINNCRFIQNISQGNGGGLSISGSNATLKILDCTFIQNYVVHTGAACNVFPDSFTISNCKFLQNRAQSGGGIAGGADSYTKVTNCSFSLNKATSFGSGMYINTPAPDTVIDCTFIQNDGVAYARGGISSYLINNIFSENTGSNGEGDAIYISNSDLTVVNGLFIGHPDEVIGTLDDSPILIVNSTFTQNGIPHAYTIYNYDGLTTIKNSIIWGNGQPQTQPTTVSGDFDITYSIIQGQSPVPGVGNLQINPLFADTANAIGIDGIWRTLDDGLSLQTISPAIDAGTTAGAPITDIMGLIRTGQPNLGAYEQTIFVIAIEEESETDISIYPNPTKGKVHIIMKNYDVPMRLYDAQGRLLQSTNVCPLELDFEPLPKGLYLLIVGNESREILKIAD